MCLKCQSYKPIAQYYKDPPIDHVISTEWKCSKGLYPKEAQDDRGNVVADYCEEYKVRTK